MLYLELTSWDGRFTQILPLVIHQIMLMMRIQGVRSKLHHSSRYRTSPRRLNSLLAICSHSKLPCCSLRCPKGIHVSLLSIVCRVCCPFDAFLPNLNLIAIRAIYIVPCESDTLLAGVNRNSRWGKTSSTREFGWKGKRLLSYAEVVI